MWVNFHMKTRHKTAFDKAITLRAGRVTFLLQIRATVAIKILDINISSKFLCHLGAGAAF